MYCNVASLQAFRDEGCGDVLEHVGEAHMGTNIEVLVCFKRFPGRDVEDWAKPHAALKGRPSDSKERGVA
eukprot:CAMPEP_0175900268 /NCGR_PEP_ID=MMETSP0108-20121206/2246_1 /TAXON_ID=195067 ORGANISM="Goniomonas pacifica, Strain CCMP1869" /NCGR_SAMPLE_ID=MMETSP0108 /ASSEMBLY_ACC=CAM_ASM_000204 /LENGTH=69 /DNA_ID=CAMNT_0017221789 /DNA_START=480 /DNA_END=685 /DNA_ORIENTATION=-